jgi:hypothetical protein
VWFFPYFCYFVHLRSEHSTQNFVHSLRPPVLVCGKSASVLNLEEAFRYSQDLEIWELKYKNFFLHLRAVFVLWYATDFQ